MHIEKKTNTLWNRPIRVSKTSICYSIHLLLICCCFFVKILFYAFSRRFYPKLLTVNAGYTFFISMCVRWELNPQPFVLLMQCSTTEPQEQHVCEGFLLKIKTAENHAPCLFSLFYDSVFYFPKKKKKTASDLASASMSFNASASTLSTNYLIFITHLSEFFYLYCEMQVFCVSHRVDLRRLNICLTHCLCWSLGLKNKQILI